MDKLDIWKVEWKDVVIEWGEREESKKRPGFCLHQIGVEVGEEQALRRIACELRPSPNEVCVLLDVRILGERWTGCESGCRQTVSEG